jgi:hypothetical protein
MFLAFIVCRGYVREKTTWTERQTKWEHEKSLIEKDNKLDYELAQKLNHLFAQLSLISVTDRTPVETVIEGTWKPWRVERNLSSSLKGTLVSHVISGSVVTNMLDACTTVFLRDGNATLQVLIPSPMAARELFALVIQVAVAGTEADTHTQLAITSFRLADEHLITPLAHPIVINRLDAACDQAIEHRPVVTVKAEHIQEGVVLGSSLTIEGEEHVFIPSGYLTALAQSISSVLGYTVEAPLITHILAV